MLFSYPCTNFWVNGCEWTSRFIGNGVTNKKLLNAYTDLPYSAIEWCISKAPDTTKTQVRAQEEAILFALFYV